MEIFYVIFSLRTYKNTVSFVKQSTGTIKSDIFRYVVFKKLIIVCDNSNFFVR